MSNENEIKSSVQDNETNLDSVLEDLDRYTCLYIDCYQELLLKHKQLEDCLNDGFLNLSKARSIIGCTNLSLLQIPVELESSVLIKSDFNYYDENVELNYEKFDLIVNGNSEINEDLNKVKTKLPHWFGVLTPLSLKQSHSAFYKSFHTIVLLCQLQSKLKSIEKQVKFLVEKKKKIISSLKN